MVETPWVVHRSIMRIVGGGSRGEFLQVFLSQNDRPGRLTSTDDIGVLVGDMVSQHLRADGGANP